jgi:hypothetical protein
VSEADPNAAQAEQKVICARFGTEYVESPSRLTVGVDPQVSEGVTPLNGLRHWPEGDTVGWYIGAGETLANDPRFFQPVHVSHLGEWCLAAIPYPGLPPGWRFLIASSNEDV